MILQSRSLFLSALAVFSLVLNVVAEVSDSIDELEQQAAIADTVDTKQRDVYKTAVKFVQPLWGSTFQTNCNGEALVNIRVTITSDKPGLDVRKWNVYYKVNGKFRESFPAHSSFASVALDPGRHVLKAELYDEWGDAVNATHTVVITVISSYCYSGAKPFGMPELSIISPIFGSVFVTGESKTATIPLRFFTCHADLRGGGFGTAIRFDGKDMGVVRADVLLIREIQLGNHTIEAKLVDSDDEPLFVEASTKFSVVEKGSKVELAGFETERLIYTAEHDIENHLWRRAHVAEFNPMRHHSIDVQAMTAQQRPVCLFFVDANNLRVALYDHGNWHLCSPESCSDPFNTHLENNAATTPPTEMCTLYRVLSHDSPEWPPDLGSIPATFGESSNSPLIVSAANSLKYMLKFWEAHLNKELYGRLMGHDYYVYLRGDEFQQVLGLRSPMFLKVLAINASLDIAPVVFFMDNDSWFDRGLIDQIPLEHYMHYNPHLGHEDWIFDEFLNGKSHRLAEINTAAFIVRDSAWTRSMLEKWWDLAADGAFSDRGLGDQILLQYILVTNMTDMLMSGDPPSLSECKSSMEKCHAAFHDWLEHYYYPGLDLGMGHAKRFPHVYFHHHSRFPFFVCHHDFWHECHEQNSFVRHSGRGYFFNYTLFNGKRLLDKLAKDSIFQFGIPGLAIRRNLAI